MILPVGVAETGGRENESEKSRQHFSSIDGFIQGSCYCILFVGVNKDEISRRVSVCASTGFRGS
jgi:hypothetical protein